MEKFIFKAKDNQGKTIKGVVEARGRKEAVILLRKRDLVVLSLKARRKGLFAYPALLLRRRVSLNQLVAFTRQLATMINAGLPLTQALDLVKEQNKGRMREVIEEILTKVENGDSLGKALSKEKKIFNDVYIASINAGEQSGVLEKVLLRLADNLEKKKEFLGKVKGAMIYPIIIIIGMILVVFIMMIFVVPKMTSLYAEFGTEMPLPTRILITITDFISGNLWFFPLIIIGVFFGVRIVEKTEQGKLKIDKIKLKLPVIGPLIQGTLLTEITRTLGTLLGTGVPLVETLKIVGAAAGNEVFRQGLNQAAERVEKGLPLSEALEENPAFPMIIPQMIATGEQTGKLDEILLNISRYFEVDSEQKVKGLTSAIEPLIMVVLGIGVGFLVFAIIMPIYNLTSQF